MYWHDVSWWGWLIMSVGMLVVYGLIVLGIARLLRWRGDTAGAGRPSPEDILGEWLARDEIDAREYRWGSRRCARAAIGHASPSPDIALDAWQASTSLGSVIGRGGGSRPRAPRRMRDGKVHHGQVLMDAAPLSEGLSRVAGRRPT